MERTGEKLRQNLRVLVKAILSLGEEDFLVAES